MNKNQEDTKQKIFKMLRKEGTLTFTQIKEKLDMTDRAVSWNLTALLKVKAITFTKKGREKHYRLSPIALKIQQFQIPKFTMNYSIEAERDIILKDLGLQEEFILDIGNKLNAFFFFVLIKSIKTGENWLKGFDTESLALTTLGIISDYLVDDENKSKKLDEYLSEWKTSEFFNQISAYRNDKKFQNNINSIHKILKKTYPNEIKMLEKAEKEN